MGTTIGDFFAGIDDRRDERAKRHELEEILVIAICAIVSGADKYTEIEMFGKAKESWFRQFLNLENGIPSHDTFGRVFSWIKPEEFELCFLEWIQSVSVITDQEIIAIDGKTLRRSFSREDNKSAIHMVSAWANESTPPQAAGYLAGKDDYSDCRLSSSRQASRYCGDVPDKNSMVLGQVKTNEKSNEITAIPKLLKLLEIHGCIVTIDAMGCQKTIVKDIKNAGGDYVIAVKGNQGTLLEDIDLFLQDAKRNQFKGVAYDFHSTLEKNHGRIDTRQYWITDDVAWLNERHQWAGLASIGMVVSKREMDEKISIDVRYYISSLPADAKKFAACVRGHWGIENSLHWVLDVAFREDESRVRKDHAPQNLAILRHIALNLIKQNKTPKVSVNASRLKSGWDNSYLEQIVFGKK